LKGRIKKPPILAIREKDDPASKTSVMVKNRERAME